MKKLVGGLAMAVAMLLPGAAFAGGSTDAALGLGAFAVFNQILGGVGIFGRPAVVAAPAPVVYAPPPVVYAPPPPVYAAPPAVVYAPAPPVFVRPAPVFVRPAPVFVRPVPVYGHGRGHGNPHWQRTHWEHRGR
ncbi:MAG TPA: hypothetical protein VNF03_00395 [Patescibacteria group bacterium]|nr:hypothetical protein [Patescibacteria group bacterium]